MPDIRATAGMQQPPETEYAFPITITLFGIGLFVAGIVVTLRSGPRGQPETAPT